MSSANNSTCHTCIDKDYGTFTWVINDYSFLRLKDNGTILSPIFDVGSDQTYKFQLKIYKGQIRHYGSYIDSVCLFLSCQENDEELLRKYKISMIKDDIIIKTYTVKPYSSEGIKIFEMFPLNFGEFISSADTVIIRCELTFAIGAQKDLLIDEPIDTNEVSVPKYYFNEIYLDKNLSDVKLRSSCGKKIPAHRVVLAAASPVFKAMFSHDMQENKSQLVDMVDISYDAAVELLRFIYTGAVKNGEIPLIIDLSAAADKYQLEGLKNKCEQILGSKISTHNVIDILKVADKYRMKNLKKKTVDFVKRNISESSNPDEAGTMILSMAELFSK